MNVFSKVSVIMCLVVVGVFLMGCNQKETAGKTLENISPFSEFPLHFMGLLPGANSESQLDLFSNNTYFLRIVGFKNGKAGKNSDDIGRWHYNETTKVLSLKGSSDYPNFFTVLDPRTIEKRDKDNQKIESQLNYKLVDSRTAKTIEPRLFFHGMYRYMADAASFRECLTGFNLPVIVEGGNMALEKAYLGLKTEPGQPVKIHIEGSIVQRPVMEGKGTEAHLLVHHFVELIPGESCENPYSKATFSNTYWRLTALNGRTVGRNTPMLREAHLIFRNERDGAMRVTGSTGCNAFSGIYKRDGQEVSLDKGPLGMTKMACPEGSIEMEFVAMLGKVTQWEISGEHLVLLGEDTEALARFQATYLR